MEDLIISIYGKDQLQQVLSRINRVIEDYSRKNGESQHLMTFREMNNEADSGLEIPEKGIPLQQTTGDREKEKSPAGERYEFTQEDTILITYPDQITEADNSSFSVLYNFLRTYVGDTINTVHILPFFPYSSDDGFSIIDFYKADPTYGGWEGIRELTREYRIMCDLVLNHISAGSTWFRGFLRGEPEYADYFITCDPATDLRQVTRPRPYPLLTPFDTDKGKKWLWTTFSTDQIDLNFKYPGVFIEMLTILLWYISKGADIIRLDAIAYVWKEIGTNCIHRPQVHALVKLFRKILDIIRPDVVLITETNVPHEENISYFGNGIDEAQMVYQFPLPPLIAHALVMQDGTYLNSWASSLSVPHERATYFNFTASHDGIGVRPLKGLVPDEDIETLVRITRQRGGDVSYKTDNDGNKSPYELNINYFSMLSEPGEEESLSIRRFLLSQSIMLTMPGVPGIYFHSLIGSLNDNRGVEKTGALRSINREKLIFKHLEEELETIQRRKEVYTTYMNMLCIRKKEKAFHPQTPFFIQQVHKKVFIIERKPEDGPSIYAIHNLGSEIVTVIFSPQTPGIRQLSCLITKQKVRGDGQRKIRVTLYPHQFLWLREICPE